MGLRAHTMHLRLVFWSAAGLVLLAARPRSQKIRVEGGSVFFKLDEQKGVPFLEFVKFAQKFTGKTFYFDAQQGTSSNAADQAQQIQLLGTLKIEKEDFYSFFQTVLFLKGWVCVPRGRPDSQFVDLVWLEGRRASNLRRGVIWVPPQELADYADRTGTYIVTTVKLRHVNAQLAAANLRTVFQDPHGLEQMIPLGSSDARWLMIMGFGPGVHTIHRLLEVVDVPEDRPRRILRIVSLEHAAAEDLEPILAELFADELRPRRPPATTPAGEERVATRVVPDRDANSLILFGPAHNVREVENVIAQLDTRRRTADSDFHVYRLQNTLAKEMHDVLKDLLQGVHRRRQVKGEAERRVPVLEADPKANTLLIWAGPAQYARIAEVIRQLDRRQDQVLIEAALIELGTQDLERLGVEIGLLDIAAGAFKRPFGFTSFGLTSLRDTDGDDLPDTRLPDFENPLRGLTGGILSSDDFAIPVIVNALAAESLANVLSIPSVLVNNNEEATVRSVDSFPTVRTSSNAVTTSTGFDDFAHAGITLSVSPRISAGGYVKLDLSLEVSRFLGSQDPTAGIPPPKSTRVIKTKVTIPSGETMVFGGVIEDTASESRDGVPFLKDLPLLGNLFRSQERTQRKTNLYFFLTPHVLSDADFADLSRLTFRKKLEASRYIGQDRVRTVDPRWRTPDARLEDPPSTIEDIDHLGGFEIPSYERAAAGEVEERRESRASPPREHEAALATHR